MARISCPFFDFRGCCLHDFALDGRHHRRGRMQHVLDGSDHIWSRLAGSKCFVVDGVQQHQSCFSNKLAMMFNIIALHSHEWWTVCHYGREHCSLLPSCICVILHCGWRKHTYFQCFVAWSVIHCTQLLEWDHLQHKSVCIVLIGEKTHLK